MKSIQSLYHKMCHTEHSRSVDTSKTCHSCAGRNLEFRHSCVAGTGATPVSGQTRRLSLRSHSCAGRNLGFILLIAFTLILSACSDFVSPERFTKQHYTLNGILKAGETISFANPVWIGKSAALSEINSSELFVNDAVVRILMTSVSGDTMSFYLTPFVFQIPDSDRQVTFYIDPEQHIIQPEYTYRIEVTIPDYDKLIFAETTVPKTAELIPNFNFTPPAGQGFTLNPSDSTTFIRYTEVDLYYPVTLRVDGYQSVNFMVELFCREEFSTALEFTTVFMGQENPPAELESNYYQISGESIRRINIMSRFISKQYTDGNWYVSLTDYRQAFVFYGRYQVTAYIMDDNFFKYKYMPEGYYYGGVHNALGCFGSATGGVMYTRIAK